MAPWRRFSTLPSRQRAGIGLLTGLLLVWWWQPWTQPAALTAAESTRIGWEPAERAELLARELYDRVNDERRARGLAAVAWSDELAGLAEDWSEEMIASGQFRHSPDTHRRSPRFRGGTGENIAMGQLSAGELHVGWMRSDGHRANLLYPHWEALGIGVVCRHDGALWATQVFGRTAPGALPPLGEPSVEPIVRDDQGMRCTSLR